MTTLTLHIRFYIRQKDINTSGLAPIRCRLTYNKNRKDFSTGITVNPDYWNPKKQKLLDTSDQEEYINMQLSLIKNKLSKAFLILQIKEETFKLGAHMKTWTTRNNYCGAILGYCIQEFMKKYATDHFLLETNGIQAIQNANFESCTVVSNGNFVYTLEEQLIFYSAVGNNHTFKSNNDLSALVDRINEYIKTHNPIVGGHFHLEYSNTYGFQLLPKKTSDISFDDLILDPEMKEDIIDNTVFHINNVKMNNGIILCGDPGTGKSLCCTAVVNEIRKHGLTSILCTTKPDFGLIEEISELFLDKSIIIFEDIDSYSESRDSGVQPQLAEFLQFLNGVATKEQHSIFIATTNHLDRLDKAIKDRPIRFNRIYEFEYPTPEYIDAILENLFKGTECESFYPLCHAKGFTGAHLADIHRSCELLSKKKKVAFKEVFKESVSKTLKTFGLKPKKVGY